VSLDDCVAVDLRVADEKTGHRFASPLSSWAVKQRFFWPATVILSVTAITQSIAKPAS
jgi:hypothetical protein